MLEINEGHGQAVMPLVLCRSNGGPYDDEGFLSGWRLGEIAATLRALGSPPSSSRFVPGNVSRLISSPWGTATR